MRVFLTLAFVCALFPQASVGEAKSMDRSGGTAVAAPREDTLRSLPPCLDDAGSRIDVNNEQVLEWKRSTPNQYKNRAFVVGTLVGVLQDKGDHLHLDVFLGQTPSGRGKDSDLEIIYNKSFGRVTGLNPGAEVAACGDFINATKKAGRYPPSPLGAILHWVHKSTAPERHVSGFLAIDGQVFGDQGDALKGPRPRSEWFADTLFWN